MRKKTISRESALTIALEAFKLDPESLPATFFIIECLRRLEKTQVPADLLRSVNQLLRRQEIVYKDAISAIGRSGTLRTANIGGLIRSYDSALRKIGRRRRIARTLPQWAAVCGTEEARIDEILTHVRAIQQQAEGKERTDKSDHLQSLLNSPEIRDAKSAVIAGVKGQCPKRWSGRRSLSTEFDACFVELILQKVDSAKLQNKASLAAYVRMTIPTMLLDQAFQEVCGLSCGQIKAVQRLRRARQTIRWRTGHEPSDEEVAQELKINGRRLHDIEQWGRQLASVSFDQDRDGCSPEEGAFSSY